LGQHSGDLRTEEDLEVSILICSLVLTFIHVVRLVLAPVITQLVQNSVARFYLKIVVWSAVR
jgi:hypothetical protein